MFDQVRWGPEKNCDSKEGTPSANPFREFFALLLGSLGQRWKGLRIYLKCEEAVLKAVPQEPDGPSVDPLKDREGTTKTLYTGHSSH